MPDDTGLGDGDGLQIVGGGQTSAKKPANAYTHTVCEHDENPVTHKRQQHKEEFLCGSARAAFFMNTAHGMRLRWRFATVTKLNASTTHEGLGLGEGDDGGELGEGDGDLGLGDGDDEPGLNTLVVYQL